MTKVGWRDFIVWQCSLRQRNFRMFQGKPSEGIICKIYDKKNNKDIKNFVSVLLESKVKEASKMFEYMSIKLPVITSNFSLYEDIVVKNDCGFCVNPFSEIELADKLEILLKDDDKVKFFGNNGYQAVRDKFNWSHEEIKLLRSYNFCLNE